MEKQGLKIKILDVYEKGNQLRVETECQYGKDNIGLSKDSAYIDPMSGKPRFISEVKKLLRKKYGSVIEPDNSSSEAKEKAVFDKYLGTELDLSDEIDEKVPGLIKRFIHIGFSLQKAQEIYDVYDRYDNLRVDILASKKLPFNNNTNEMLQDYYGGESLGYTKNKFKGLM